MTMKTMIERVTMETIRLVMKKTMMIRVTTTMMTKKRK